MVIVLEQEHASELHPQALEKPGAMIQKRKNDGGSWQKRIMA